VITQDWQAELAGVTVGAGTRYHLVGPITGLGIAAPRVADQERGDQAGDVTGRDVASRRVLTVPIGIDGVDAGDAWTLFDALKAAWSPTAVDVPFDLRLPGFAGAARRFYGRPRGLDSDLAQLRQGWIDVLATFDALDPYGYGPEVTVALPAGATVMNGSAPTDRYRLTLAVTGSPATVTVGAATLTLDTVPGTLVLDGRTRTVTTVAGTDRYSTLVAGSTWPVLAPGSNTVTVAGATGSLTFLAGYF
jgi:hypothetical protein